MNDIAEKIALLHSKDAAAACRAMRELEQMSARSNEVYFYFGELASMLGDESSYVRSRALSLLAANAAWDDVGRFNVILDRYLRCVNDPKPITARQCIKALPAIASAKPELAPRIIAALKKADPSRYADSMRPLIEKDIERALAELAAINRAGEG